MGRRQAFFVAVGLAWMGGGAARADDTAAKAGDVVVAPNEEELARRAAAEDVQRRRHGETDRERIFGLSRPRYGLDIGLSEGLAQDSTGVHTMIFGAVLPLADTHVALDGKFMIDSWTQWDPTIGISAYGFGGQLGVRLAPFGRQLRSFSLELGTAYFFILDGAKKKISDNGFGTEGIGNNAIALHAGLHYGFPTTRSVTMIVHLDANYWLMDVTPYPPEFVDPYPHPITVHLGLEFLLWRE